jgi:hypothetical protein
MALTIWDPAMGASREANQADIDVLQAKADAFGRFVAEFRGMEQRLSEDIAQIRERWRTSAELSG